MLELLLPDLAEDHFLPPDDARRRLLEISVRHPKHVQHVRLGESEEGRPIDGYVVGRGDVKVSLIAGNHSDEPVGPDFLRRFVPGVARRAEDLRTVLERFRFYVVPHTNPDGEQANAPWRESWPSFTAYLEHAFREPPGRDLEFGYPDMRPENDAVASWLRSESPFHLHGSLHGMGIAEGALLLIERHWGFRTSDLQKRFLAAVRDEDLDLHDHNRKGEKGFFYLGPGFWTTPEGAAMRAYFESRREPATATLFHDSSMEFVRNLGGDPLCYVTEIPLFVVQADQDAAAGEPSDYVAFKERLHDLRIRVARGEAIAESVSRFGLRHVPLRSALRLQLRTLAAALREVDQKNAL